MTTIETEPPIDGTTEATLLVEELVAALVNSRIYAISHPRVQDSITAVGKTVRELTTVTREDQVRIACADGMVVFQRRPLLGASIGASRLLQLLEQWGSGGIELDRDVDAIELQEFFTSLTGRRQPGSGFANLNELLVQRNCRRARLLPPYVEGTGTRSGGAKVRLGLRFYQAVIDLLQTITVSVCRGGRIDFAPVQAQAEQVLKRLEAKDELQFGLARHEQYDAFTLGHSLRVAILSMNFAKSLTTDRDLLIRIGTAALLHDVGKSLIPFEILHSTGLLSPEERVQMNRHAELGAECLLDHHDSDPLAIAAAFGHHRAPDGSGYPRTVHVHHVAMVTSVVKICDVFEALTAARPYKQPMSPIRAYRVMIAMGDKLDQSLLRKFIEVNGIYPTGQLVELKTGEVAIVRGQGRGLLQPTVAVVESVVDRELVEQDEQVLDLADINCGAARAILRELTPDEAQDVLNRNLEPAATDASPRRTVAAVSAAIEPEATVAAEPPPQAPPQPPAAEPPTDQPNAAPGPSRRLLSMESLWDQPPGAPDEPRRAAASHESAPIGVREPEGQEEPWGEAPGRAGAPVSTGSPWEEALRQDAGSEAPRREPPRRRPPAAPSGKPKPKGMDSLWDD